MLTLYEMLPKSLTRLWRTTVRYEYEVLVGDLPAYRGPDLVSAQQSFGQWADVVQKPSFRVHGQTVTLVHNGAVERTFDPSRPTE